MFTCFGINTLWCRKIGERQSADILKYRIQNINHSKKFIYAKIIFHQIFVVSFYNKHLYYIFIVVNLCIIYSRIIFSPFTAVLHCCHTSLTTHLVIEEKQLKQSTTLLWGIYFDLRRQHESKTGVARYDVKHYCLFRPVNLFLLIKTTMKLFFKCCLNFAI